VSISVFEDKERQYLVQLLHRKSFWLDLFFNSINLGNVNIYHFRMMVFKLHGPTGHTIEF